MALSRMWVIAAKLILWELFPESSHSFVVIAQPEEISRVQDMTVVGLSPQADGSFASVFLDIEHITDQQKLNFWDRVADMPLTPFCTPLADRENVTRLGWT